MIEKLVPGQRIRAVDWNELADAHNALAVQGGGGGDVSNMGGPANVKRRLPMLLFKMTDRAEKDGDVWRAKCKALIWGTTDDKLVPSDHYFQGLADGKVWVYFPTTYFNRTDDSALEYPPRSDRNKFPGDSDDVTEPGDHLWGFFNEASGRWEYVGHAEEIVRFALTEDMAVGAPSQAKAKIWYSTDGTAEPSVKATEVITVVDWAGIFAPAPSGSKGFAKRKADLGRWEVIGGSSAGVSLVFFELVGTLQLGQTAVAKQIDWTGAAFEDHVPGVLFSVRDPYQNKGQFEGAAGYRGLAMKVTTGGNDHYLIVWMEHRARLVHFRTHDHLVASITADVLKYWQGKNPGAVVTVNDSRDRFHFAQPGALGLASWDDDLRRYEIVEISQLGDRWVAEAAADFSADTAVVAIKSFNQHRMTFWPIDQDTTAPITSALNTFHLSGKAGDTIMLSFDESPAVVDFVVSVVRPRSANAAPYQFRTTILTARYSVMDEIWELNTDPTAGGFFFPIAHPDADLTALPNPPPVKAWNRQRLSASAGDSVIIESYPQGADADRKWIVTQVEEHPPCWALGTLDEALKPFPQTTRVDIQAFLGGSPPRDFWNPPPNENQIVTVLQASNPIGYTGNSGEKVLLLLGIDWAIVIGKTGAAAGFVPTANLHTGLKDNVGANAAVDVEWPTVGDSGYESNDSAVFLPRRAHGAAEGTPYTGIEIRQEGLYLIRYGVRAFNKYAGSTPSGGDPTVLTTFGALVTHIASVTSECEWNVRMRIDNATSGATIDDGFVRLEGRSEVFFTTTHDDSAHNEWTGNLQSNRVVRLRFTTSAANDSDLEVYAAYLTIERLGPVTGNPT